MRTFRLAFCLALASTTVPSIAFAHGGQFRGPVGGLPNGLRPPEDPQPPSPAPDPVPTPRDPDPAPGNTPRDPDTPAPTGPVTPGTTPNPDGSGPRGKTPTLSLDNWTFWWAYNNADILRVKEHIYGLRGSSVGFFGLGDGAGNSNDATRATAKQVKQNVIPALLWAMDSGSRSHPDTESAAYLALAKVTDDPAHIPLLVRGILESDGAGRDKEAKARHVIVRESAILSLGLLRRAENARRFDARELDAVREICFRVLSDTSFSARIRSFAAFSIALLADQPTSADANAATPARTPADRLFDLLRTDSPDSALPSALLLSLSFQPATAVTAEMREVVAQAAVRGRLFKASIDGVVQSYAALALGRIGTESEIGVLMNVMSVRATPLVAKRSAAIALGRLARTVDGPARASLAANLHRLAAASNDPTTRNFGLMSVAQILSFEASTNRTDVINAKGPSLVEALLKVASTGSGVERPYGALALGLIGRAIGEKPDVAAYGEIRLRAINALSDGFSDKSIDPRSRGAFAIALGLIGDASALKKLTAVVADRDAGGELRGYSAVAIGLLGIPAPESLAVVKRALGEKSSEELRLQCAVCLGLLGQSNARDILLAELADSDSQFVQGQVVQALGKIGDAQAIPPLIAIVKDVNKPDQTRAMACAGLGLVGDLEMLPSLSILSSGINYRALVDPVAEMLTIL